MRPHARGQIRPFSVYVLAKVSLCCYYTRVCK